VVRRGSQTIESSTVKPSSHPSSQMKHPAPPKDSYRTATGLEGASGGAGACLAASYGRKSDPDDAGLDAQLLVNTAKAKRDGYVIPNDRAFTYEDDDTTGRKTSREDLDRLVAMVTSGKAPFSRVYIKDKTRQGRFSDPRFHFYLQVLFERHGVLICYSDREVQLDFSQGDPRDMFGLLILDLVEGITSSEELTRLIRRVTEGSRTWAIRKFFPGSHAPYATVRWYADEATGQLLGPVDENAIVRQKGIRFKLRFSPDDRPSISRRIFDSLESGLSLAATARSLNEAGCTAPRGGKWYPEAVRRIAQNPIYRGALLWGRNSRAEPIPASPAAIDAREPILVEDFIPDAPVSLDQFERVQRILKGVLEAHDRRRRTAPAYPLSGLIICGLCGATWHGFTSTARFPARRRYYRHGKIPKSHADGCANRDRYMAAQRIEPLIERLVSDLLQEDALVTATHEALHGLISRVQSEDHEGRANELEALLRAEERKLDRLVEDRAAAESATERDACHRNGERANARIKSIDNQLAIHQAALDRARTLQGAIDGAQDRSEELLGMYADAGPAERRSVYLELLRRIVVGPDVSEVTVEVEPF
jgi:hypothetical protein